MKLNLLGFSLFLYFQEVLALSPANINKVQYFDNGNHQFIRRNVDQDTKPFNVTHICFGDQCKKVSEAIGKLTDTLSSIIQVKNQIKIDIFFGSYCEQRKLCNLTDKIGFGDRAASRSYAIKNKDGKDIRYPSALYKQLVDPSKNDKPMNTVFPDIALSFNSDDKYWFEGDRDIKGGQPGFVIAAARNLIRGLGVYFSIGEREIDEFGSDIKFSNDTKFSNEKIFTPGYTISSNGTDSDNVTLKFNRHILDTLVVTTSDGKSINSLLDQYINFNSGNVSISMKDIPAYLRKTPLIETSKKIENLATSSDSLAIKLPSGKSLILETSIHPYDPHRSLKLISESRYLNTKDALLTPKMYYGEKSLSQEKVSNWPTYPFGPLLIETLECLGYTLKDSYKNSEAYSSSNNDGDRENSISGSNSLNTKVNFGLLAALVPFYLLY